MRANQIFSGFSETLLQDERILSSGEKELLANLLHKAGMVSGNPEVQAAVVVAVQRAVGETVAQRAFGLLGGSIVEQIVSSAAVARTGATINQGTAPHPSSPSSGPEPPSANRPPGTPSQPEPTPVEDEPMGPEPPSGPSGPHGFQAFTIDARRHSGVTRNARREGVEILEATETARAKCVVLDEFLNPQELKELMQYTLHHESEFQVSEVISASGDTMDYNHRRSRVLMDLQEHEDLIVQRIRGVLPQVLRQLDMEDFPVSLVETQITASGDGDFFRIHSDDGQDPIASRALTFVYFFHREPRRFKGGELRLHDAKSPGQCYSESSGYRSIVPQQNQIVFFPCSLLHEITPVECTSENFADCRFTVNGWLRR